MEHRQHTEHHTDMPGMLKDPVCGMSVTENSTHREEFNGTVYYFCSDKCRTKFVTKPAQYAFVNKTVVPEHAAHLHLHDHAAIEPASADGTIYTCPMHPEIRQDHPGSCPKCGMTLEAVLPELDENDAPELTDFRRRFWWTLPLTVIVTVLAMAGHRLAWFDMSTQSWIELLLSLPVVLWAGWPFFERGWLSVVHRSPNMWTLIGLGTGASFLYSVVATMTPQVFPDSFRSMGRISEACFIVYILMLCENA